MNKVNKEFIQQFESCREAYKWLYNNGYIKGKYNPGNAYKINQCLNGKAKSAFGFAWSI